MGPQVDEAEAGGPAPALKLASDSPAQLLLDNRGDDEVRVVGHQLLPSRNATWPPRLGSGAHEVPLVERTVEARSHRTIEIEDPGVYALETAPPDESPRHVRAQLTEPTNYSIGWRTRSTETSAEGWIAENETRTYEVEIPRTPIDHVEVEITWNDAEDDIEGPDGETVIRSRPDRFRLAVEHEDEDRRIQRDLSARQGRLAIRFPNQTDRAANVTAADPWEAFQAAGGGGPLHSWLPGTIQIQVTLENAGDSPASPGQGPTEDGGSSYELTVETIRADPHPIGPGSPPPEEARARSTPDQHQGHDHDHTHAGGHGADG